MNQVIVLELNELNFAPLLEYARRGLCPNFESFFRKHGYCETTSEVRYAELEPWIQWVTAHTGLSFAEHGIFRLGDAVNANTTQIWEHLEADLGVKVGALSPMNAVNRLKNPAYFVPDPWTPTPASGPWILRQLSNAVAQAVNDNATGRLTFRSLVALALGIVRYARPRNYFEHLRLVLQVFRNPWNKVLFLDLFLSDVFVSLNKNTDPAFSTLFLNGGANLQHHYMLNSLEAAGASLRNPEWYVSAKSDPVGDIYRIYDRILGQVISAFPNHRILIMTGLHQDRYPKPIFYWRLRNHADFLRRLGCEFAEVQPRMSRDFVVNFEDEGQMERARSILLSVKIADEPVFSADLRKNSLFVELVFPGDIEPDDALNWACGSIPQFRTHVVFVALKNGHHNGVGYFSDSGRSPGELPSTMSLSEIHREILRIFGAKQATLERPQLTKTPNDFGSVVA